MTPPSAARHSRRVLIVGGVAGGASCAARLRRLDESVEIVIFDRGPYVSFANCGLPYYVGNVIADERALLVASQQTFRERFGKHYGIISAGGSFRKKFLSAAEEASLLQPPRAERQRTI